VQAKAANKFDWAPIWSTIRSRATCTSRSGSGTSANDASIWSRKSPGLLPLARRSWRMV
jgi:hypothetical protein